MGDRDVNYLSLVVRIWIDSSFGGHRLFFERWSRNIQLKNVALLDFLYRLFGLSVQLGVFHRPIVEHSKMSFSQTTALDLSILFVFRQSRIEVRPAFPYRQRLAVDVQDCIVGSRLSFL